jgi:dihydropyrimidinase
MRRKGTSADRQKPHGRDDFSRIQWRARRGDRMTVIYDGGVRQNRLSLNRFVELVATAPAALRLVPAQGTIAVGSDADIVLFDPIEKHVISAKTQLRTATSRCSGEKSADA